MIVSIWTKIFLFIEALDLQYKILVILVILGQKWCDIKASPD